MRRSVLILSLALLGALLLAPALGALSGSAPSSGGGTQSSGGSYTLDWYTIDGGGVSASSGGSYSLAGSIGQTDAGTLTGAPYRIDGGFWPGIDVRYRRFLPLLRR